MNVVKMSTPKQRKEIVKWISTHAEDLTYFFSQEMDRVSETVTLFGKIEQRHTQQIEDYEKNFLELILNDQFDKTSAIKLTHELLKALRTFNKEYKDCYSMVCDELFDMNNILSFLSALMSKQNIDLDELDGMKEEPKNKE